MSNSCESNGDHLDMRHYFLIVLLGEIFYGVVSGQIICDVDPNLNEKIFPQSIPEQNENQNPFHQYFSPVHVQADRSKRSSDLSDQRRPFSNSFRRHNPPVKSSGQSGSQLNDELQESSDYLQSNNNQNFLPPLNSVADINNNNEFQKYHTLLQTNNSSLSNSSVQSNTGDAQQQPSLQELKYSPVPLAKPPVSNGDFEFDNLDDDDSAQNMPINGFNPRSNPDAGQTELGGPKISSNRSGRKRRAPDVNRNPQTRRGGPGGSRNPNTNRGRPGNPNQNMNQRPNKNRNPNVRRPGGNPHPKGQKPGGNPHPNGQKPGGNPPPNMQKPGGNKHPNMQTPGGNSRSNIQKPGGNPRSKGQNPRGNRPNMQTPGGNRPMQNPGGNHPVQKPGRNRPMQKPGGNRPMQNPDGNRPMKNPSGNRPMQKPGGNRPMQKPGGNRPMQKPGRNRPNIQKPGGNQNFKNGLNPPLQNNDDNGDYDDSESENQDKQPSSTVPSNSGEELSSDETSDTDDFQFPPDTSNDYPNTQLPEGFADDLLSDLDDSQSDEFLPTTESDDDSNQDSTPQIEETDEPQESSPDNSDSNTDTEPASSQTQPGPRRRPGSPSRRPGGPHRTRPPGVTRNPQMRKRKPGVTRNPKVTRPGGGGNSQNGLGPPTQENNDDNDGDSSEPSEEPSKDDTNDKFSTQPLDGISSDVGDEDYSLSTPEIEDQVSDSHPNTEATALTDDPQIPPGVPDDFPGYKFPDGFISDLLSDLDTTSSTEKHHSKDEHHSNDEHHSKDGMKQPRRRPYGGMRNHAGSLHNQMYPKRRRQNFKRVRIPSNISNLKQQPNHFKKSGDVPPTINKPLDKSEPEQHFSEVEQDNSSLQDNTYPSDFEVTTPANDYDIPQYDNLDDYASQDGQPIPNNDKFAVSPHVKRNRNLSRPKQHRTKGLSISRPLEQSMSESETDKATEEDFPATIDGSFDLYEPKQHFSEIEQDNTSSQDDIYPSEFEITTPENDYGISQLNNFEDFSSQDDQPLPNNVKFAELPPHMKRNRNRFRPKQHKTKGLRILKPLESSTSESETETVTEEDFPPTIDGSLYASDPQQHFSETEENNAYSQDDNYPTDFEVTTLANDYDSPQLNNSEDYTSQDDRPIPHNSKFAQFPPHMKRNRNRFRPKQHRTKGSRISPSLKSSTSESDIDTTTEDDYSSQYPLKQKSGKVTGPGEIYSLPYNEWWKHLHTIKSPNPEKSTEELTQQSTQQYTDNPTEDDFSNQDSSQQTVVSQDDGRSILVPDPESHRITPGEKSTSSIFRQTHPHAENDRLKSPYQRRRRPLQPNLRNKDANNKYRTVIPDYNQRGKKPLNFSDRLKNFGTQKLPDKIDTTTEDQSPYKNSPRTFNENNDTAENGDIAVSNDEDTTLYESSTSYELPSQTESQVFTPKSFVTQNELREKMRRKHPKLNRFPDGRTKLTRRPHLTEADIEAARKRLRQKFTDVLADDDDTTVSTENNGYNFSPETLLTQTGDNVTPENYFPQTEPFNSWKRTPPHFRRRLHPSSIDFADVTTEQQTFQQEPSDEQSNTDDTNPSSSDYEYEFPTPSELNYDNDDTTILINNYEYESTTVSMDDYRYKSTAALINDYKHEYPTVSKEDDKYKSTTSLINNYDYEFSSNPSDYKFTSIPSLLQTNYEFPSNPSLLNTDYEYSTLEHTSPENILDPSERKNLPHTKFGFLNSGENMVTHTSPVDFTKDRETEPQDYQEEITNTESTILNIASSENSELEFTTGFPDGITATEVYSTTKISPSDLTYNSDAYSDTELLTEDVSSTAIANLDEDSSGTDSATESGSTMEVTKNSLKPFRIKDASHPDMRRRRRKKIKGKNITHPPYPMENRRRKTKIPTGIPNDFPNFSFPGDFFSDMLSGLTETPSTEDSNESTENAEINTETPCTEDAVINTEAPSTEQTEINTETPSTGDAETPSTGDEEINTEAPNTGDEEINTETPSTGDEEINTETLNTGDAELNTETPSKGYKEINRETSNNERITHIKPKKRGKKKKAKKSKIHRPKESRGKTEETSNEESSTVTYSGTKEKESSTIFMTEPVTTPVTELDTTTLVSSSALPTTWPPDITSISESIITSESPITIMTIETTNTIIEVSDLSAQISLSTTEAPFTASKVPTATTKVPTSSTEVSTSTTEVPTSTTEVPTSSTEVPTSSTEVPTSTTEVSTSTTEVPTSTAEVSTSTTEVPTSATEASATSAGTPIITMEPSTTTEITFTTSETPSTTTEVPSTTTEIPSTTSKVLMTTEMPTTTTETFTTEVPFTATEIRKATSDIPTSISKLSTTPSDISTKITQVSKTTSEIPNLSTKLSTTTTEDISPTSKIPSRISKTLAATTKTPPITTTETPTASKKTVTIITETPVRTSKSSITVTKISTDTPTVMTEALTTVSEIPKTTAEILGTSEVSTTSEKISTLTTPESIELTTIPATSIPIATASDLSISATEFTSTVTSIPTEITEQTVASPSTPTAQITTETEQLSASELLTSSSSQISTSSTNTEASSPGSASLEATNSPDPTNMQPSISQSSTSLESGISPSSQEPIFTTETSTPMDATLRSIATKSVSTIETSVPSLTTSTPIITTPISSAESTFTTSMESSSAGKTSDITEEFGSSSDIVNTASTASSMVTEISSTPAMNESTTLIGTTTEKFHASPLNNYTTIEPPAGVQCYENESYYACVPHCQHTCFNYDSDEPCPDFCEPGCGCNKGLLIDEKGRCVPPEDCFELTCGLDEEWWDCKPKCHNTCPNFARAEACEDHPTDCEPGCYCRDGLILDVDGSCVEPEDCDDPVCDGEIEEETDCMDQCNTCAMICHTCKMTMCRPGCDCKDGYKRDINGTCIHVTACPPCPLPSTTISV